MIAGDRDIEAEAQSKPTAELLGEMAEVAKGRENRCTPRWYVDGKNGVAWITADGELKQEPHQGKAFTELSEREAAEYIWLATTKQKVRRSRSAKKAAQTRVERQKRDTYRIANRLIEGGQLTPSAKCVICGKKVTDDSSYQRGVGSDCWQAVLRIIQQGGAQ